MTLLHESSASPDATLPDFTWSEILAVVRRDPSIVVTTLEKEALTILLLLFFVPLFYALSGPNGAAHAGALVWLLRLCASPFASRRVLGAYCGVSYAFLDVVHFLLSMFGSSMTFGWRAAILRVVLPLLIARAMEKEANARGDGGRKAVLAFRVVLYVVVAFVASTVCRVFLGSASYGKEMCFVLLVFGLCLELDSRLKNRDLVVEELKATERSYSRSLRVYLEVVAPALETASKDPELVATTTMYLPELIEISERFSVELEKSVYLADGVGSLLVWFSPFFKAYAPYCAHHAERAAASGTLLQNEKVQQALANLSAEHPKLQTLDAYLIMPVQRPPRLLLLAKELLKKTPSWHPDYAHASAAVTKLQEVVEFVNSAVAKHEDFMVIVSSSPGNRGSLRRGNGIVVLPSTPSTPAGDDRPRPFSTRAPLWGR